MGNFCWLSLMLLFLGSVVTNAAPVVENAYHKVQGYDYTNTRPTVKIIREGEEGFLPDGGISFPSSVVYISDGPGCQVLVDTGVPTERDSILQALEKNGVKVNEINYVVISHYHPDHMGNMNVFNNVTFITSNKTFTGPTLRFLPKTDSKGPGTFPFQFRYLCPNIAYSHAKGHTDDDTVVFVFNATGYGNVAITGDVFTSAEDIKKEEMWASMSIYPDEQRQVWKSVLTNSDFVVPGHGAGFRVTRDMKDATPTGPAAAGQAPMPAPTPPVQNTPAPPGSQNPAAAQIAAPTGPAPAPAPATIQVMFPASAPALAKAPAPAPAPGPTPEPSHRAATPAASMMAQPVAPVQSGQRSMNVPGYQTK